MFDVDLVEWVWVVYSIEAMSDDFWCSFAAIFWGIEADDFFEEVVDLLYFFEWNLVPFALFWQWIFDHSLVDLAVVDGTV